MCVTVHESIPKHGKTVGARIAKLQVVVNVIVDKGFKVERTNTSLVYLVQDLRLLLCEHGRRVFQLVREELHLEELLALQNVLALARLLLLPQFIDALIVNVPRDH